MDVYISALIVTGGYGDGKSVELLHSDGTPWCSLPNLPDSRVQHTQSGLVACGGRLGNASTSCVTFSGGQWNTSHSLLHGRYQHSSWTSTRHGTILMGGRDNGRTTEMLTDTGESQDSFTLKYDTL